MTRHRSLFFFFLDRSSWWPDKTKVRQGLFILEGRGTQVRAIKSSRTDNETQVKLVGQKREKRRENMKRTLLTGNTRVDSQSHESERKTIKSKVCVQTFDWYCTDTFQILKNPQHSTAPMSADSPPRTSQDKRVSLLRPFRPRRGLWRMIGQYIDPPRPRTAGESQPNKRRHSIQIMPTRPWRHRAAPCRLYGYPADSFPIIGPDLTGFSLIVRASYTGSSNYGRILLLL